jgi:hypothetical protein
MFATNDFAEIKVNYFKSAKKTILTGLIVLLIISMIVSYYILLPVKIEGKVLGHLLVPLIIISEIPILVNYLYFVILKFSQLSSKKFPINVGISKLFTLYYTPGLILHSILYSIVVSLVLAHTLLVMDNVTSIRVLFVNIPYCMIFLLILALIWLIELIFWMKNWPLFPEHKRKEIHLYWIHWFFLFSTSVFAIFHSGAWSQSIFLSIGYITFAYVTFAGLFLQDKLNVRVRTEGSESKENLVN